MRTDGVVIGSVVIHRSAVRVVGRTASGFTDEQVNDGFICLVKLCDVSKCLAVHVACVVMNVDAAGAVSFRAEFFDGAKDGAKLLFAV